VPEVDHAAAAIGSRADERFCAWAAAFRLAEAAGHEPSGAPAWKTIPSFFEGASHVVMTSHPEEVTGLIVEAANVK
jgi:hypothetical protein